MKRKIIVGILYSPIVQHQKNLDFSVFYDNIRGEIYTKGGERHDETIQYNVYKRRTPK